MAEISLQSQLHLVDSEIDLPKWATPTANLKSILSLQHHTYNVGNCAFQFIVTPRVVFQYWLLEFPNQEDAEKSRKALNLRVFNTPIISTGTQTVNFKYPKFFLQLFQNYIARPPKENKRLWNLGMEKLTKIIEDSSIVTAFILTDKVPRSNREFEESKNLGQSNFAAYGFARFCRDNKIGTIQTIGPIINQNHSFADDLSMSQIWLWIPPKSEQYLFKNPQGDFKQELPKYPTYSKSVQGVIDKSAEDGMFL